MKAKTNKLLLLSIIFFTLKGLLYLYLGKYLFESSYWSHWFFIPIILIVITVLWIYSHKKENQQPKNRPLFVND